MVVGLLVIPDSTNPPHPDDANDADRDLAYPSGTVYGMRNVVPEFDGTSAGVAVNRFIVATSVNLRFRRETINFLKKGKKS